MIIELPNDYERCEDSENFARIREGILELKGKYDFQKIMVELTYILKGNKQCHYCQKIAEPITIDHRYPVSFGGVTITNNLEPACRECNGNKADMNPEEFGIWQTLTSLEEKKRFYQKTIAKKKRRKRNENVKKGFDLPKGWIRYKDFSFIIKVTKTGNHGSAKFNKMLDFVQTYNKLPRPLVISSNNVLLDGETAYAVADALNIEEVPVIILDNVVVLLEE